VIGLASSDIRQSASRIVVSASRRGSLSFRRAVVERLSGAPARAGDVAAGGQEPTDPATAAKLDDGRGAARSLLSY
jgi:hypothetical protein